MASTCRIEPRRRARRRGARPRSRLRAQGRDAGLGRRTVAAHRLRVLVGRDALGGHAHATAARCISSTRVSTSSTNEAAHVLHLVRQLVALELRGQDQRLAHRWPLCSHVMQPCPSAPHAGRRGRSAVDGQQHVALAEEHAIRSSPSLSSTRTASPTAAAKWKISSNAEGRASAATQEVKTPLPRSVTRIIKVESHRMLSR